LRGINATWRDYR